MTFDNDAIARGEAEQTRFRDRVTQIAADDRRVEKVNHPAHYGGGDNPYEAIKVIEAWDLKFSLGNAIKYILRAGFKPDALDIDDLKKAAWYVNREIDRRLAETDRRADEGSTAGRSRTDAEGSQKTTTDL